MMTAVLAIEARDYVGGAVVITVLVALLLGGVKIGLDRLLDRRRH